MFDTLLFVGGIGPVELMLVMGLVVLLFGAQKLPELARASGQAMGEFTRGREEIETELGDARSRAVDVETDAEAKSA